MGGGGDGLRWEEGREFSRGTRGDGDGNSSSSRRLLLPVHREALIQKLHGPARETEIHNGGEPWRLNFRRACVSHVVAATASRVLGRSEGPEQLLVISFVVDSTTLCMLHLDRSVAMAGGITSFLTNYSGRYRQFGRPPRIVLVNASVSCFPDRSHDRAPRGSRES